ncbi:VTT domain-containing protein [Tessaracoccus sp. OS52]|uniref:VTT domain-containing protein n=1 Tax=Tessaracoccus sp. OS52 TaxID=2886691 RepID=UPI001D11C947|nr:VTT domain-containing protein [Tessaracoccus sp. OS52]MCC2593937.1 VTT domain-containing protein [Tessaracoccus sp. OS52]
MSARDELVDDATGPVRHADGAAEPSRWRHWAKGRRLAPWTGPPTAADKLLLGAILAVVVFGMALRPAKPFLIAERPVLLEFLSGDLVVVGAAAAFARIGEAPLWLVVVAGAVGLVKFDVLTWWAGRRWGEGIIAMLSTPGQAAAWTRRLDRTRPWVISLAVALAMLPGVPTAVVFAVAGWSGMRLATFLLLDLAGALALTGLVAGLGFGMGQQAVDLVLLVDQHASTVSLALIAVALLVPLAKKSLDRLRRGRTKKATVSQLTKETP